MGMSTGQKVALGFGVGTGVILFRLPADLIVPMLGVELGTIAAAYGAYQGIPVVRQTLDDVAERTQRLIAARPQKALPQPVQNDPADVLAHLLADGIRRDLATPSTKASTGTTKLILRTPEQVQVVARAAQADVPQSAPVLVTYHPELWRVWAGDPQNAGGMAAFGTLDSESFDTAIMDLLRALGLTMARVAADSTIGPTQQTALTLLMAEMPLTTAQHRILDERCGWWRSYQAGRVRGVLVVLRPAQDVAVPARPSLTYDDLDALDGATPAPAMPVMPVTACDDDNDDTALPDGMWQGDAPVVASSGLRRATLKTGGTPIVSAMPARQVSRVPSPLVPFARVVGDSAIPTVEITTGYNHMGQWVYRPLKHGIITVSSGKGKSNALDLILGQLQALGGVDIWYGTAKTFVKIDPTDRLDRRPVIENLPESQVALSAEGILPWLWRATKHMEGLYERMSAEPGWFPPPTVVIFDELQNYLDDKEATKEKAKLGAREVLVSNLVSGMVSNWLTKAREAGGNILFTSQDAQCGSLKLSRGKMMNLGFRQVHPTLDPQSLLNALPEGGPEVMSMGPHDWFIAGGGLPVEVITIPRVSTEMFEAWGLLRADGADAPDTPTVGGLIISDDTPSLTPESIRAWATDEMQAGRQPTLTAAAAQFGVDTDVMRDALRKAGLLGGRAS